MTTSNESNVVGVSVSNVKWDKAISDFESEITLCRASVQEDTKIAKLKQINTLSGSALKAVLESNASPELKLKKVDDLYKKLAGVKEVAEEIKNGVSSHIKAKAKAIEDFRKNPSLFKKMGTSGKKTVEEKVLLDTTLTQIGTRIKEVEKNLKSFEKYAELKKEPKVFELSLKFPEDQRFWVVEQIHDNPSLMKNDLISTIAELNENAPTNFLEDAMKVAALVPLSLTKEQADIMIRTIRNIGDHDSEEVTQIMERILSAPKTASRTSRFEPRELAEVIDLCGAENTKELILKVGKFIEKQSPYELIVILKLLNKTQRMDAVDPLLAFCQKLGPMPLGEVLLGAIKTIPNDQIVDVIVNMLPLLNHRGVILDAHEFIIIMSKIPQGRRAQAIAEIAPGLQGLRGEVLKELLLNYIY